MNGYLHYYDCCCISGCRLQGKLDPDWEEIWTEGFPSLKKLNVRNVAWDDYMNTYADRLRDVIMNSVYEIVR